MIKNVLVLSLFIFGGIANAQTTKKSLAEIENVIKAFSQAVDSRNADALEPLLNENFRVVANRFPTDDKTSVLNKEVYLKLLKEGKVGGEKRTVEIKSVDVETHMATAKVIFTSDKATFTTFQSFILNQQGTWQLVADMPFVKKKAMKLTINQKAPTFSVKDVNGQVVDLNYYKGKKVFLVFFRFAGCPICNLRFHELESNAEYFASKNTTVLAVYESSEKVMKEFIENESFKTTLIPDPTLSLYNQYDLELSTGKLLKGVFKGALGKAKAGKNLFKGSKKSIKQDGNTNRVGAEFLIDENGNLIIAHYGSFVGDDLPLDEVKKTLNNKLL